MIKRSDVVTIFGLVLFPALFLLAMVAASRQYWLLLGTSLAGFQIAISIGGGLFTSRQITTSVKRLEQLISKNKGDED